MKTCAYCGRENEDEAVHCAECGTDEFKTALLTNAPVQALSPDAQPSPTAVAHTQTDSNPWMQFVPRGQSKLVFVLAVTPYGFMLSMLIGAVARAFHLPPAPISYYAHFGPIGDLISSLVFAPIFESFLLLGLIELARVLRGPHWAQVVAAASVIAILHCFPWRAHGLTIAPVFAIQAASYLYWRPTSRKAAYGVVAWMHLLHNLIPAISAVAHSMRHA